MPKKVTEQICKICKKSFRTRESMTCSPKCHSELKKGKDNPNWNGGTSFAFYDRIAKENLIQKCCLCGSIKFLLVHHKDGNRKNNNLDNLMVVCKSCHAKIHDIQKNINKP